MFSFTRFGNLNLLLDTAGAHICTKLEFILNLLENISIFRISTQNNYIFLFEDSPIDLAPLI